MSDLNSHSIGAELNSTDYSTDMPATMKDESGELAFSIPQLSFIELTVLANYLYHCGPFLHSVVSNINTYHTKCSLYQVTPVKHLSR